jgi:hypothetical protein
MNIITAAIIILLVTACLAWANRFEYEHAPGEDGTTSLLRINRFTGEACRRMQGQVILDHWLCTTKVVYIPK